jgi:hypothetical protein
MQSDCVDLGQQITIYRLKPVDGEILIEKTGKYFGRSCLRLSFKEEHSKT